MIERLYDRTAALDFVSSRTCISISTIDVACAQSLHPLDLMISRSLTSDYYLDPYHVS